MLADAPVQRVSKCHRVERMHVWAATVKARLGECEEPVTYASNGWDAKAWAGRSIRLRRFASPEDDIAARRFPQWWLETRALRARH